MTVPQWFRSLFHVPTLPAELSWLDEQDGLTPGTRRMLRDERNPLLDHADATVRAANEARR